MAAATDSMSSEEPKKMARDTRQKPQRLGHGQKEKKEKDKDKDKHQHKFRLFRRRKQKNTRSRRNERDPPVAEDANPEKEEHPRGRHERQSNVTIRTAIMGSYEPAKAENSYGRKHSFLPTDQDEHDEHVLDTTDDANHGGRVLHDNPPEATFQPGCATAIFQQSILFCGREDTIADTDVDGNNGGFRDTHSGRYNPAGFNDSFRRIVPEDPTVEESFECMVATQLEAGFPHDLLWEDSDDEGDTGKADDNEGDNNTDGDDGDGDVNLNLLSPAALLQTRSKSRLFASSSGSSASSSSDSLPMSSPIPKPRKTFRAGSLVHLGTFDPQKDRLTMSPINHHRRDSVETTLNNTIAAAAVANSTASPSLSPPSVRCCDRCRKGLLAPGIHDAKEWPQRPLLLRPTPGSGTRVRGIRYAGSSDYLWKDGDAGFTWMDALKQDWTKQSDDRNDRQNLDRELQQQDPLSPNIGCSECMILPINNGNETKGKSLVVDFVTPAFEGTILLRIRHCNGTTPEPYSDNRGYFKGLNRRYQLVIHGTPLRDIPLTECTTGARLTRPVGKLPSKWIMKGAIKVLSFFAPQMTVVSEGQNPYYLTPLGSTPQVLRVGGNTDMEKVQEEPTKASETVLGKASDGGSSLQRAKMRKKLCDKLYVQESKDPKFRKGQTYTFEFLQHLFDFPNYTVELGSMLGSIELGHMLNGQPMQIMAETKEDKLWAFDIWHESLMTTAVQHDKRMKGNGNGNTNA